MAIIAELDKKSEEVFPHNKIILSNDRMLDCFPLATQVSTLEEDRLELDQTGQYISIGRKKSTQVSPLPADTEEQQKLFVDNAFYLLARKERILNDSRMFLCPIAVQSGLAYTGTSGFNNPTLGIYLEWWSLVSGAMRTDKNGLRSLVYQMSGSPLSGANKCRAVREDGKLETVTLLPFSEHWSPFIKINQRYTAAKQLYQAFTLQEVLDILKGEDDGTSHYDLVIDALFMKHEIDVLYRQTERIQQECKKWYGKYSNTLIKYNEAKMRQLYADYEILAANVGKEIDSLTKQKRDLKANLKKGRLDNITYQKELTPLKKRISDLLCRISCFKYDKVHETFPDEEDIDFGMIKQHVTREEN